MKTFTFNITQNFNLSRWDEILPRYTTDLIILLEHIKRNLPSGSWGFLSFIFNRFSSSLPYDRERIGICRMLKITMSECILLHCFFEYFMESTTFVFDYNTKQIQLNNSPLNSSGDTVTDSPMDNIKVFFRHFGIKDFLFTDELKNLLIMLDVKSGTTSLYKAITFAGYTGYLTVVDEVHGVIYSVESYQTKVSLSYTQVALRYIKHKWTAAQMLRYVKEQNKTRQEIVGTFRYTDVSIPSKFIYVDSKYTLQIIPPVITRYHQNERLMQVYDEENITNMILNRKLFTEGYNALKRDKYEDLNFYEEEKIFHCKLLNKNIIINGGYNLQQRI